VGPLVVKVLGPASVNHPIEYEAIGEMKGDFEKRRKFDQSLNFIIYHHILPPSPKISHFSYPPP